MAENLAKEMRKMADEAKIRIMVEKKRKKEDEERTKETYFKRNLPIETERIFRKAKKTIKKIAREGNTYLKLEEKFESPEGSWWREVLTGAMQKASSLLRDKGFFAHIMVGDDRVWLGISW